MVAMAYAWLFLSQLSLVASLAPGDCTFVENGEDFALVLKEDVNGETLSLTEHPISGDFVKKFFVAKKHVSAAKKGTVLKKADFETSFMAPTFLTVFTGSATDPTPLCSINLAKNGVGNKLPDDVKTIIPNVTPVSKKTIPKMAFGNVYTSLIPTRQEKTCCTVKTSTMIL